MAAKKASSMRLGASKSQSRVTINPETTDNVRSGSIQSRQSEKGHEKIIHRRENTIQGRRENERMTQHAIPSSIISLHSEYSDSNRGKWAKHFEFFLSCLGFAVGLGNLWRFPYLVYDHGGGVFLVPYVISLFVIGIPLLSLELYIGQYTSLGPVAMWNVNVLFKGLGVSMVVLSVVLCLYYNIVIAISIYFLFASMTSDLLWTSCGNEWNTCACRTHDMPRELPDPLMWFKTVGLNCTGLNETIKSSSEEYYFNKVLQITPSMSEIGVVNWELTLCNLLAWMIIAVVLVKGIQSMGKAMYFFTVLPYVLITVMLIRGLTLDGSSEGIKYYLSPDPAELKQSKVWRQAASQIFFSLSVSTGSMSTLASYNKFNENILQDGMLISIFNCLTSFYAGFAVFSVLGFMAHAMETTVDKVAVKGPGLVFVVYPEALSLMPVPQLWSCLHFLMLIFLGLGSQFPSVETFFTTVEDMFQNLREDRRTSMIFRLSSCAIFYLISIIFTTTGGNHLIDFCDHFTGYPLLFCGFFEVVAIVWIYGPSELTEDVMMILGPGRKFYKILYKTYFKPNLVFATPAFLIGITLFEFIGYKMEFEVWAEILGWLFVTFIMIYFPVWYVGRYIYEVLNSKDEPFYRVFIRMNRPNFYWGPNSENRRMS